MVDILQANANLYDVDDKTKINYLEVGEPPGNPLPTPPAFPGLWVTNSRPLETIKPEGTIVSDSYTYLSHDVEYDIKFLVVEQDSIVAEKQLDDLQKLILETLEANTSIGGKANTSWPTRVDSFRQTQDGTGLRGRVITYKLKITTS